MNSVQYDFLRFCDCCCESGRYFHGGVYICTLNLRILIYQKDYCRQLGDVVQCSSFFHGSTGESSVNILGGRLFWGMVLV